MTNGNAAALAFETFRTLSSGREKERVRAEMLEYCDRDTWGMLEIYRALEAQVGLV